MATATQAQTKTAKKSSIPKQQTFSWEGVDKKGNKVKGELPGQNVTLIKAELRKQGIVANKVKKKATSLLGPKKKKITPMDVAVFTRQLATMMKAGVPLVQSFEIVADGHDNPSMRDLLLRIKGDIEGGNNLASSLAAHPAYFDDLFVSLVDSGEQSGALETMLDRIAIYKEKTEALKAKIKKAIKYPIAVVVVACIVTAILLIKVVPTFQDLFAGFGAELPAFTQMVIDLSEWMQEWWFIFLLGIIAFGVAFAEAKKRSPAFCDALDRIILKMPVAGDIIYKATIARYARTLATTFSAGVPLVEALESVAGATGNVVYRNAVNKIRDDVSSGTQLNFSMKSAGVFPAMAVQMTAIGEESGALDTMLDKVATYYEDEVDNAVDGLTSLLEPLIMAVLGVLVGGLIIAMYLPIFQLGSVV
ncbi:MAG: type II secretion system protein F [Pseudomonadales bacterium]|nr:type II secretion system protein F [Pseudomonadales bacterium]MEC8811054.1 type II secretion system F family protein [Pseudomonadota bacterium]TNC88306.1 MAG: type II secretion system protein F [Alcanivorax sp.]HCB40278.1 type II secretion system protein F [Gammaproteobacteria bacterium]MAQ25340.1 type II secretion system protein F [Pseudomonadales bacterium]|tara:strand:- start:1210 stop:2466 length:1257 start_codon:yes stop_codon:yes gene_type:complete